MHTYPANENRISEVERGRSCEAVIPQPPGGSLLAGESVLFALSESRAGQEPRYVKGGDSVLISISTVTDLGMTDPVTGQALVRVDWEPLGQQSTMAKSTRRPSRTRRSLEPE